MTVALVVASAIVGCVIGVLATLRWRRDRAEGSAAAGAREPGDARDVVHLEDVLDGHPTGVIVADAAGTVRYRNLAASAFAGTHTGALLDAAVARHLAAARSVASGRETLEFYGPPRTVFEVWGQRLPDGGSVAFVEDVSERRRVDRVRTDFVANISHELRTPVGALAVLAETIADETDPATIRRIVARMLAESDRAAHTIDELIELSRIEAGADRQREPVSVAEVVRGAVDRVRELAARRDIAITALDPVDAAGQRSAGMVVLGDRRELVSALGNLVENAVKYSEADGSVQVRASRNGPWVEIAVVDRGIGIPQRDLDRVFERFYRVDRARSRHTGGTGLGLSIVRHVASNHGGEVLVASVEGEGSTFTMRLPAHVATDAPVERRGEGVA